MVYVYREDRLFVVYWNKAVYGWTFKSSGAIKIR
jgi:hypothetical protein